MNLAQDLARWAHELEPSASDLALAERSLRDTVAVALAGAEHPVVQYAQEGSVALSRNWPCKTELRSVSVQMTRASSLNAAAMRRWDRASPPSS